MDGGPKSNEDAQFGRNFWNSTDSGNPAENKEINGPTHLTHLVVLWSPRKKVTSILFIIKYIIYKNQATSLVHVRDSFYIFLSTRLHVN